MMKSLTALLLALLFSGCAMGHYGLAGIPGESPHVGPGMTVEEVVDLIGVPDHYIQENNIEYLDYDGMKGWWAYLVFFGLNFGHTEAGSLELRFENSKLVSQQYVGKGESTGIWTNQNAIGE
jgi:hypothetical protein